MPTRITTQTALTKWQNYCTRFGVKNPNVVKEQKLLEEALKPPCLTANSAKSLCRYLPEKTLGTILASRCKAVYARQPFVVAHHSNFLGRYVESLLVKGQIERFAHFLALQETPLETNYTLSLKASKLPFNQLSALFETFSRLEALDLSGSQSIDECTEQEDFKFPASLKDIALTKSLVFDAGLKKISRECPNLQRISLERCVGISQNTFCELQWPNTLESIDLSYTYIDKAGLIQLFKCCPKLKELKAVNCINLALDDLPAHFPASLQRLDLSRNLGDIHDPSSLSALPSLKQVTLNECPELSQGTKEALKPLLQ